jgi:putative endopeptidase
VSALVGDLIEAYRQSIETLDWMGRETQVRALEKLSALRPKIGYPDRWRDYGPVDIRRDDLVGSVQR